MSLPNSPLGAWLKRVWPSRSPSRHDVKLPRPLFRSGCGKRGDFVAFWSVLAGLTGCASTGTYDPDHLGAARADRIAEICQTTLGLSPKEPPVLGVYSGSPHLDREVSHYQVCIAGLSDSVLSAARETAASQVQRECRAKGYTEGTADLAVCVLQQMDSELPVAAESHHTATLEEQSYQPRPVHSFFYASPREVRHREELACARLGLEPPNGAFAKCVTLLNNNFYAIDNPIN